MKKVKFIRQQNQRHWVGDGFPVRSIFTYDDIAEELSPFLLMDYAGPTEFEPTTERRGVGEHPHRGIETVSIIYHGEVEHRDSAGGGGKIGPGEVQWMTAGSGLVHEEFHGKDYARKGGHFEMIQLWVNLARKDKMTAPKYQSISKDQIPEVSLPNENGLVRIIAGSFAQKNGPASTFTPMNVWDVRLKAGADLSFRVKPGDTTAFFVLNGSLQVAGSKAISDASLAVLERDGDEVFAHADKDTTLVVLNGTPLNEPIVGYGPFVMNTEDEIRQAFMDFRSGKMGRLKS